MFGTFTRIWGPSSSAPNESHTSHPRKSATTDETMDSDGSEDVMMIPESAPVTEGRPNSPPRASDGQSMTRDTFEDYEQKQTEYYSRLNNQIFRLQKLDQASSENIQRLLKELASKMEEVQEAQRGLADTQIQLNACKEAQKRLEEGRLRDQAELKACKTELREWRGTVAHIHNIAKDLPTEQKAHEATQRGLQAYNARQDHAQDNGTELQDLREKLAASRRELSACKDDLFRLQPIAQIADSDISKDFDFICQQIVNWIDGELLSFEQANPHLSQEDFFAVGGDIKIARRLQKDTELEEYLSRHMIHRYLEAKLFGQNCALLGLPRGAREFLERTERSMAKLDPPRDRATIAAWRSETFKAIARTEESQQLREKQIQAMTMSMSESFSETFPVVFGNSERMERFHIQVMEPASKLATTLRESCSTYWFHITETPFLEFKPLTANQIKSNCMVDIKTRMTLKPNTGVVADKNGVCGKCIIMLEPVLYRVNEGKKDSTLRKGAFLVELDHPITKRK
ncbi:hypothetical protein JMJ35_003754 [Cladonia borealis]|uniref:Uncharacterized protein n=1 Tax=Cladonia borealis TaxID=184061 RepID=A0AA39V344_9LECA|nr:hypothetical protein JMJ35_003754 [Cladonia borealis]